MKRFGQLLQDALYPRTIGQKLTTLLLAGSIVAYGILTFLQYQTLHDRSIELAQYTHRLMTEVMARRIGDALATGRKIEIDRTLLDTIHVTQNVARQTAEKSDLPGRASIAAFGVFREDGRLLKSYNAPGGQKSITDARLAEWARQVIQSGRPIDEFVDDINFIAYPVRAPLEVPLTGVVVIAWDMRGHFAEIRAMTLDNATHGAAVALILIGLLLAVVHRWIVNPITSLSAHIAESGQSGELGFVDETLVGRRDEIGVLAGEFNKMVEVLADSRQKLLNHSYVTGMAEMASGVLHNIRNALNPISVGIWKLEEAIRHGSVDKIESALVELAAPDTPADRREKLTSYVRAAAEKLGARQARLARDIGELGEHSRHVEQILQDVDLTGRRRGADEAISLDKLAEECARMIPNKPGGEITVEIDPALSRLPAASGNRLTIAQVVGNLMINAAESIRAAAVPAGRVEVTGRVETVDGRDMIHLEIRDNGEGIALNAMESLFHRGYSTKSGKKGGIGLHWCANNVIAMGGRIYATSGGQNRGATFHLLLPAAPRRAADPKPSAA